MYILLFKFLLRSGSLLLNFAEINVCKYRGHVARVYKQQNPRNNGVCVLYIARYTITLTIINRVGRALLGKQAPQLFVASALAPRGIRIIDKFSIIRHFSSGDQENARTGLADIHETKVGITGTAQEKRI